MICSCRFLNMTAFASTIRNEFRIFVAVIIQAVVATFIACRYHFLVSLGIEDALEYLGRRKLMQYILK